MSASKRQKKQEDYKLNAGIIAWIIAVAFSIAMNLFRNTTNWFGWVLIILEAISIILVCQKKKTGRILVIIGHTILGVLFLIVAVSRPVSWQMSMALYYQSQAIGVDWWTLEEQYKNYMTIGGLTIGCGCIFFALYFGLSDKVKKILNK